MLKDSLYDEPLIYDLLYSGYADDIGFYQSTVAQADPRIVVELGAGTGRLTHQIARDETLTIAVDRASAMLRLLADRCRKMPRVSPVQADARTLVFQQPVDLVIAPFNFFAHFERSVLEVVLRGMAAMIPKGGLLAFDVPGPGGDYSVGRRRDRVERAGTTGSIVITQRSDMSEQQHRVGWTIDTLAEGRRLRRRHFSVTLWRYTSAELEMMLRAADFIVVDLLGDFAGTPADSASPKHVVVARRR